MQPLRTRVATLVVALGGALVWTDSAHAVELKPLMREILGIRIEVGKEIHLTDGEVADGAKLASLVATAYPPAAPYIAFAIARVQRENRNGNGVIIESLWLGQIVGVRPR